MMVDKDGQDVTQYAMTFVEKVGLVKFDFLGLTKRLPRNSYGA